MKPNPCRIVCGLSEDLDTAIKTIKLMIANAGNPDPKKACQLVIETGKKFLESDE